MAIGPVSTYHKPTPPPPPPPPKKEEKIEAKPVATTDSQAQTPVSKAVVQDGFDSTQTRPQPVVLAAAPGTPAPAPAADPTELAPTELAATSPANAPAKATPVGETAPTLAPAPVSGEQKAQEEIDIQTVSDDRADIQEGQKALGEQTNATSNELFDMAEGKTPPPPNTKVTRTADGQVEVTRTDAQGQPIEYTRATRGADGTVTLDSSSYQDGTNYREQTEARGDGSTRVQRAEWKSEINDTQQLKPFEEISKSRDPNFTYTDNFVSTKDDKLVVDEYAQSGGAVSGSHTEYFQQDGDKGIDNKLEGHFDFNQKVDRADTYSYSIPAPQNGEQGEATYQRTQRFSQENYQTTSVVDTALKDEKIRYIQDKDTRGSARPKQPSFYKDTVKNEPHNREDLEAIRDYSRKMGFEERFDANQAQEKGQPPKRWYTEWKNGPDELRTQTGVEGFPKATIVTDKKREGSTITEKYAGHTFKPGAQDMDDLVAVGGESSHTYGQDGSVEASDMRRVNADGSKEEAHYKSRTEQTAAGLVHHESTESQYTKEGQTSSMSKQDDSLINAEGIQLLGTTTTLTGPDGTRATSTLNEHGESLTVTGPNGQDPRVIDDPSDFNGNQTEQDLALQAATSSVETTKAYVDHVGVKALDALEYIGDKAGHPPLSNGMAKVFDAQALNKSLTDVRDARLGGSMASHSLGALSGALNLAAGIRSGNKQDIITGALSTAWGAGNLVFEGKSVVDRIKGNNPYDKSFIDKLATPALESMGRSSSAGKAIARTVEKMGGAGRALGALAGPGLDIFNGAMDIQNGLEGGHTGQFAKGVVGVVGGAAGMMAAVALSGPAAVVVAPLIGLGVAIISGIIELVTDDKHQIAELSIDDEGFQVTPPDYDSAAAPPPPPEPEPEYEDEYWMVPVMIG